MKKVPKKLIIRGRQYFFLFLFHILYCIVRTYKKLITFFHASSPDEELVRAAKIMFLLIYFISYHTAQSVFMIIEPGVCSSHLVSTVNNQY